MNIKEFIEKAIEGGWMDKESAWMEKFDKSLWAEQTSKIHRAVCEILLDQKAWQAVGKVEGWPEHNHLKRYGEEYQSYWARMHRFIDALCDDKPLEIALNESTL